MEEITFENRVEFIIIECQDYLKGEMSKEGLILDLEFIVGKMKDMTQTEVAKLVECMLKQIDN